MTVAAAKERKLKEVLVLVSSPLLNFSGPHCMKNQSDSLVGIQSADGGLAWKLAIPMYVQYINCSLIDATDDGVYDCLVFSFEGTLSLVNSLSGIMKCI